MPCLCFGKKKNKTPAASAAAAAPVPAAIAAPTVSPADVGVEFKQTATDLSGAQLPPLPENTTVAAGTSVAKKRPTLQLGSELRFSEESRVARAVRLHRHEIRDDAAADIQTPSNASAKSWDTVSFLENALAGHFMFESLSSEERTKIANHMSSSVHKAGATIIKEGEDGDIFYILEKGTARVVKGVEERDVLKAGDTFGDMALLYGEPRTASIVAIGTCVVHGLQRNMFRRSVQVASLRSKVETMEFLNTNALVSRLEPAQREAMCTALTPVIFLPNQTIVHQGEAGSVFFFIRRGTCLVSQRITSTGQTQQIGTLVEGMWFGEAALLSPDQPRSATIIAGPDGCMCFALDAVGFKDHCGPLVGMLEASYRLRVIRGLPALADLEDSELAKVVANMEQVAYSDRVKIQRQGDKGEYFYIIKKGSVTLSTTARSPDDPSTLIDTNLKTIGVGEYFGETALIDDRPCEMSARALGEATCYRLKRSEFDSVLRPWGKLLQEDAERRRVELSMHEARASIKLDKLEAVRELGSGSFGHVRLMKDPTTGTSYALKTLRKRDVAAKKMHKFVLREKHVMWQLNHPFILSLYASFMEPAHLCMLLEFCPGGDLLGRMDAMGGTLPVVDVRFYTANVVLALEYLHQAQVMYRDMKPENILVDQFGYLKMSDFGMAKVSKARTFTTCGSPQYMSPEMILAKGHDCAVDCWGLGVMVFEMLYGWTPWNVSKKEAPKTVCRAIVNKTPIAFPAAPADAGQQQLILGLCNHDLAQRLGAKQSWDKVKTLPFFAGLDWGMVFRKEMPTPWQPTPLSADIRPAPSLSMSTPKNAGAKPSARALEMPGIAPNTSKESYPLTPLASFPEEDQIWENWDKPVGRAANILSPSMKVGV